MRRDRPWRPPTGPAVTPAFVAHPDYGLEFPGAGRFPLRKFTALRERLTAERLLCPSDLSVPRPASVAELSLAHDPAHVLAAVEGRLGAALQRRLGFPWSAALVRRARAAVGGTVLAARLAPDAGVACNLAGGSHHAGPDGPSGFCLFNDVAVAIRVLQAEGAVSRALVVDLDVHQGDGTARIFAGDPTVFTFSVHCRTNFPARKARSSRDLALEAGAGDTDYLAALRRALPEVVTAAAADIAFYNAGVDPHADDRLGRLALTDRGLAERDALVLETLRRAGLPVVCVVGGGYGEIEALADRHAILHRVLADLPAW